MITRLCLSILTNLIETFILDYSSEDSELNANSEVIRYFLPRKSASNNNSNSVDLNVIVNTLQVKMELITHKNSNIE